MPPTASPSKAAPFDYSKEKTRIDQLIGQWSEEKDHIKFRRESRKKEINVTEEQQKGTIPANGTFIARRIIDRNIRLEKPELVAYLEQTPRTVLFKSLSQPTVYYALPFQETCLRHHYIILLQLASCIMGSICLLLDPCKLYLNLLSILPYWQLINLLLNLYKTNSKL